MQQDVRVAMANQVLIMRNGHTAQSERSPLGEPVRVMPDTYSTGTRGGILRVVGRNWQDRTSWQRPRL